MKIFSIKESSIPWISNSECRLVSNPDYADWIIYESVGEPIQEINNARNRYPRNKLVFILSGDRDFSDDVSLWFASNVKPSPNKFQIYITNPRIYAVEPSLEPKSIFGYFGGTIWDTAERQFMHSLSDRWLIEPVNNYWGLTPPEKVEISNNSYEKIKKSTYTLCPRGKGPSSMRIVEALACGSIPILIHDHTNPFDDNFGDLILRLSLDDITRFDEIVDNMPTPTTDMPNKCIEFYKKNICVDNTIPWSVCSGFSHKIIDILKTK